MNSVLSPFLASGLLEIPIPGKPRTLYTAYSNRVPEIRHIACGEFKASGKRHSQSGVLDTMALAVAEAGAEQNLFTA